MVGIPCARRRFEHDRFFAVGVAAVFVRRATAAADEVNDLVGIPVGAVIEISRAVRLFEDGRAVIVDTVLCRRAQLCVLRKIISRGSIFQDGHHVGKRHFPVAVHIAPGIEHVGKAAFQGQQRIQGGEMPVEVAAAASGSRGQAEKQRKQRGDKNDTVVFAHGDPSLSDVSITYLR